MDNSSRNTVIFIATITFSAMLLMAAHFYSDWRDADAASAIKAEKAENTTPLATEASVEETSPAKDEDEEEFPEEEDFPPMGEPTVDLDENDTSPPAVAPLPSPQPVEADIVTQSYEANN
jgi:hypothetical protein